MKLFTILLHLIGVLMIMVDATIVPITCTRCQALFKILEAKRGAPETASATAFVDYIVTLPLYCDPAKETDLEHCRYLQRPIAKVDSAVYNWWIEGVTSESKICNELLHCSN